MKASTLYWRLGTVALAGILSGCATKKLWEISVYNEPAPSPNLQLFLDRQRQDVLVAYVEMPSPSSKSCRWRAFYAFENEHRLAHKRRPKFVAPESAARLEPLPIIRSSAEASGGTNCELYATLPRDNVMFVLCARDEELGVFKLPKYPNRWQRAGQIALTPFAVVADVALVSVVVGAVAWAYNGFPPLSEQSRGRP